METISNPGKYLMIEQDRFIGTFRIKNAGNEITMNLELTAEADLLHG